MFSATLQPWQSGNMTPLPVAYIIRMSFCWAIEFLITFLKSTFKIVLVTKIRCSLDEFFVAIRTSEKNCYHELFTALSAKFWNDLKKNTFLSSGRIRFYFSFLLNSLWISSLWTFPDADWRRGLISDSACWLETPWRIFV